MASDRLAFRRITPRALTEAAEALGAATYVVVGLAGMALGGRFLQNVLPLGRVGDVLSSGTIALLDVAVGLEVSTGFVILIHSFLEQTLELGARGE